jgi:orotidine-5'-phosphate decarboxylase
MNALDKLNEMQSRNDSIICLGLDLDAKKMPAEYSGSTKKMFDFAHWIIDATADKVCAYKPNIAFYERYGGDGLSLLKQIIKRIPDEIPVILDCKRGDIGNTASHYAASMFEWFGADWVTLNPYMGYDSLRPFIEYKDKGVFVLCLTSNTGARDFQELKVDGKPLYRQVAEKVSYWNKDGNCGLVVGATHMDQLKEIREVSRGMPLLIPGVGAQGGSLENAVITGTANFTQPAVINVSRSVLYASNGTDFAKRAREELEKLNNVVKSVRAGQPDDSTEEKPETEPDQDAESVSQTESPEQSE